MGPRYLLHLFGFLIAFSCINLFISLLLVRREQGKGTVAQRDNNLELNQSLPRVDTLSVSLQYRLPASSVLYQNNRVQSFIRSQPERCHFIFIPCKNLLTETQATDYVSNFPSSPHTSDFRLVPYIVPYTALGEYYFLTNIVGELTNLSQDSWIGIFPWHSSHASLLGRLFEHEGIKNPTVDFIVASSSFDPSSYCPGIKEVVHYLLTNMDESTQDLSKIQLLGRIGFMARAKYMQPLATWLSRAVILLTTDPHAQQMMANMCGDESHGSSLYPLLGEVLISYFFYSHNIEVVVMDVSTMFPGPISPSSNLVPQGQLPPRYALLRFLYERYGSFFSRPKVQIESSPLVNPIHLDSQTWMLKSYESIRSSVAQKRYNSSLVFVLCDNQPSYEEIMNEFSSYSWAVAVPVPSTYILDAYFYTNILENIMDMSTPIHSWVGSIRKHLVDMQLLNEMLNDKTLIESGYDVLSFFDPLEPNLSLQAQADQAHPGLMDLIDYVLQSIGERGEDIQKLRTPSPTFKGIFSYKFVCRSQLMQHFIFWFSRAILFLMTDAKAQSMVWKQSGYEGPEGLRNEVYGSSFYPFHSFFSERLVSFYFNARGFKIMTVHEYKSIPKPIESLAPHKDCRQERYSAPEGLGQAYDISLFYHIGMIGHWRQIVDDQLSIVEECGLGYLAESMTIAYVKPPSDLPANRTPAEQIQEILMHYPFSSRINISIVDASSSIPFERTAMETMSSHCQQSLSAFPEKTTIVFYFHNKGSSKYVEPGHPYYNEYVNIYYWRRYMEFFLLERPTLCTRAILNHGTMTCGVNLQVKPSSHYSGNFWAASCAHIKDLPVGDSWKKYDEDPDNAAILNYISAELWIGNHTVRNDGDELKFLTLFNVRGRLYDYRCIPEVYSFVVSEKTFFQNNQSSSYYDTWELYKCYDPGNQTDIWLDYLSGIK